MALSITINKVAVADSFSAGTKVADIVVSGGTSPYSYSLASGGDYFQISGTEVQVINEMDISNIQSFSVTATDSTSGTALTVTSEETYPNLTAKIQSRFNSANKIYKITQDLDLGHGELILPSGCTLDFQGGSFRNGTITGNKSRIIAGLYKILSDVLIKGTWCISKSYVEWAGCFPDNSSSVDFKDAYECIRDFNTIVILQPGTYYSNKGDIQLKWVSSSLTDSMNETTIQIHIGEEYNCGFYIGNWVRDSNQRTTGDFVRGIKFVMSNTGIKGAKVLVLAAASRARIIDCVANAYSSVLSSEELTTIMNSRDPEQISSTANSAIYCLGTSEQCIIQGCSAYGDIGINIYGGLDFLKVQDCLTAGLDNGFANIMIKGAISNCTFENLTFNLNAYGFYFADKSSSDAFNSILKFRASNIRMERLKSPVAKTEKSTAYSIWIGKQRFINRMLFDNIYLAQTASGIYIAEALDNGGTIVFQDVTTNDDASIEKYFYNFDNNADSYSKYYSIYLINCLSANANRLRAVNVKITYPEVKNSLGSVSVATRRVESNALITSNAITKHDFYKSCDLDKITKAEIYIKHQSGYFVFPFNQCMNNDNLLCVKYKVNVYFSGSKIEKIPDLASAYIEFIKYKDGTIETIDSRGKISLGITSEMDKYSIITSDNAVQGHNTAINIYNNTYVHVEAEYVEMTNVQ